MKAALSELYRMSQYIPLFNLLVGLAALVGLIWYTVETNRAT